MAPSNTRQFKTFKQELLKQNKKPPENNCYITFCNKSRELINIPFINNGQVKSILKDSNLGLDILLFAI